MSGGAVRGRLRPTKQQRLLLECAFSSPDRAEAAWREARPRLDLDTLDTGSHALMPLVYRRLADLLETDRDADRIKGIYRKTWYANRLLLAAAAEAFSAFADAGVRALALHGVVLADRYYEEPAVRPLTHVDVVVRNGDAMRACYALGKAGWVGQRPDLVPAEVAVVFRNARGSLLALHRTLPENMREPGEAEAEDVWADATETTLAQTPAHVLSAADELLCAVVAGPDATLLPNVQWIADAATIVGGTLDWDAFSRRTSSRRVVPHVAAAFEVLRSIGLDIPDVGLGDSTRRDRIAYRLYARPDGLAGGLPRTLGRHVRESGAAGDGVVRTLVTLPRFLKRSWGVTSGRALVGMTLAKARRRLSARSPQAV